MKLLSDYQNQYKRFQKEKIDILKYSNKELILSVLPIVDDFKRSFLFLKKKKNIYLGIHLIYKKLLMILKNYGLKKSNTKIGDKYDYSKHEVIDRIKKKKKNIVLEIIENGYYLNNSLIRYDKVIISF
ncbi:MAG: nucleotide exchange factor GrpE [Candidatus Shikimatogenerans sp. Tser]|uniref:Nucleotide exchange factor GrpE n=1 Tax=Candidatus Shikimatogenerans sp. Tser TaxID=3158568 RepID=A0AAU7QR42_9FLAO